MHRDLRVRERRVGREKETASKTEGWKRRNGAALLGSWVWSEIS